MLYHKIMNSTNQNGDYIDWNNEASYVLQYLYESEYARHAYQHWIHRVNLAMVGRPYKNLYQEELLSNLNRLPEEQRKQMQETKCTEVPEGLSFALSNAVQNIANQMASGVDTYEYTINDPYMIIDDETEDLLAAKCEQDYAESRLDEMSSVFSSDLTKYGMAAAYVKYCPETDKNEVLRINPKNVWFDTMYNSTGVERFRGYSTMVSWSKLKEMIELGQDEINTELEIPDRTVFNTNGAKTKFAKYGNKKITTLNDLDIYVEDINKLATSPSLQGYQDILSEYDHDLHHCYNLNWYHTFATDASAKTNSGYQGNDVELTVLYDLNRRIEFKIINRRFVISANRNAFKRSIAFPITNPISGETTYRIDDFHLDCPLKFRFESCENRDYAPHPTSSLFPLLEVHDQLCSWRSKRDHVTKILSILRIETNGADAESLRGVMNIMGVVIDCVQGDINTLNFAYDYSPIDSQIQYLEDAIKVKLHAYDQFDAMQSMGDRASAAESGMAIGAVAQGLATHQNAIMSLYADIARQCIANRVAYSPRQEFPINNFGEYRAITIQQMALDAVINVKSKLARKVQERAAAANAITLAGTFKDIINENGLSYFISQAMMGNVTRKMAKSFLKAPEPSEQEVANAQLQAQNQAQMLQQNQAMYEGNPMPYEAQNIMDNASPEEVDDIIGQINAASQEEGGLPPEALEMAEQDGSIQTNLEGISPEAGSMYANANSMFA